MASPTLAASGAGHASKALIKAAPDISLLAMMTIALPDGKTLNPPLTPPHNLRPAMLRPPP